MKRILTITFNPTIDVNVEVEQVIPNQKLRCSNPVYEPGGGAINVSRAIKRLGGESLAMYPAGGQNGGLLRSLLDREGIQQRYIEIEELTRESLVVYEHSGKQQFRFVMPGPEFRGNELERFMQELSRISPPPDFVVASGSLPAGTPADLYAKIAVQAKNFGAKYIVDTSGEALKETAGKGVFVFKTNFREFQDLYGKSVNSESEQEKAARELLNKGICEVLVVSLGAAGAILASDTLFERLRAPIVPVKSRVGAGDSMVAGIVLSLARGWDIHEAVIYGLASGTAAVMTPGTELCRLEDTEELYRELKLPVVH